MAARDLLRSTGLLLMTATAFWPPGAAMADRLFVTCQSGEQLTVIDRGSNSAVHWPLPGRPAGIAVTPIAVFVVSPDSKEVRRLDAMTGAEQRRITLDGGPMGIALDPKRGRVFVSDWYSARIWVLDSDTLAMQAELTTGAAPAGLALSDDGGFLASADRDGNQVSVYDAETLNVLARYRVGERPYGLAFDPDGRIFVGNVGSDTVSVLDPKIGLLTTIAVGARPYGVAFAAGRAFVTNQYADSVSVIDLVTLDEITRIPVGEYPEGINASSDGTELYVANWFDNTISRIDAQRLEVTGSWETADGPRAFGNFVIATTQ